MLRIKKYFLLLRAVVGLYVSDPSVPKFHGRNNSSQKRYMYKKANKLTTHCHNMGYNVKICTINF